MSIFSDFIEGYNEAEQRVVTEWNDMINVVTLYAIKIMNLINGNDWSETTSISTKVDSIVTQPDHSAFVESASSKYGVTPDHFVDLVKVATASLVVEGSGISTSTETESPTASGVATSSDSTSASGSVDSDSDTPSGE